MADKKSAAAHIVDRVLFESGSDTAGLLEFQRRSITRFGMLGDGRISSDRSYKIPSALQFIAKRLGGVKIVFCFPHLTRGGVGCDDGE
jgi:hypothetical protein